MRVLTSLSANYPVLVVLGTQPNTDNVNMAVIQASDNILTAFRILHFIAFIDYYSCQWPGL